MRFSSMFLFRNPILRLTFGLGIPSAMCKSPKESPISTYLRMTLGLGIPSAMCKSPGESPISTYLILDESLLCVLVQETNLEDDVGVGDPLCHVQVPQGVTDQHLPYI